jgi:hypothetical protein
VKLALAAAVLAGLGTLAVVPSADAEPSPQVSVVWPEVTKFNPDLVDYDAVVTNNGTGRLFYAFAPVDYPQSMLWDVRPVPESGHLTLAEDQEGQGAIQIWSCLDYWSVGDSCTLAATSPELSVRSHVTVFSADGTSTSYVRAGLNHHRIVYGPQPPEVADAATGTWEILDATRKPLASPLTGPLTAADMATDADYAANVPFTIPADLPRGHYFLDVHLSVEDPDFGPLHGSLSDVESNLVDLYVDSVAPRLTVGKLPATLYPVADGYLDQVGINAKADETTTATFEVTNAAGARVFRVPDITIDSTGAWGGISWDGYTNSRQMVPAGAYTLKLTATDLSGNTSTWTGRIAVSRKSLRWTTYATTVSAAQYVVGDPLVGSCSTLAHKAHHALGFYSQTKCKGSTKRSVVAQNFGMYIPKAFNNRYDWAQITLNGGPATKSRKNYIIFGYVHPSDGAMVGRKQFGKGNGAHVAGRLSLTSDNVFDRNAARPYLIWTSGLNSGSRYNVRSFTVKVQYLALR